MQKYTQIYKFLENHKYIFKYISKFEIDDLICFYIPAISLLFLCVFIDCWHSVPLLPVQTHCSNDAL